MNWDWLPWRGVEEYATKDLTPKSEDFVEACNHDFEKETELLPHANLREATFEAGHLVIEQSEVVEERCTKCGEPGYFGKEYPYESYREGYAYAEPYDGKYTQVAHKLAFEPTFAVDPDVDLSEAISEPVTAEADFVVDDDGETEKVEGDGPGRILVSRDQQDESDDDPVEVKGRTN